TYNQCCIRNKTIEKANVQAQAQEFPLLSLLAMRRRVLLEVFPTLRLLARSVSKITQEDVKTSTTSSLCSYKLRDTDPWDGSLHPNLSNLSCSAIRRSRLVQPSYMVVYGRIAGNRYVSSASLRGV